MQRSLVAGESTALLSALDAEAVTSIRANPTKTGAPEGVSVPWCTQGHYLNTRPLFAADPFLHTGAYYVQEASSMLLEQAFVALGKLKEDARVVDLCAAPGGKSTHMRTMLPKDALLVSNEVDGRRQPALQENIWKWGLPNVVITQNPVQEFAKLGALFDIVVLDAPCSGEGLFRKDGYARGQWSPQLVVSCARRQTELLEDAWKCLLPSGYLIYSTCTYATAENEDQVERMVHEHGAQQVAISHQPHWGTQTGQNGSGLCCLPHRVKGEGFFIAVLRKPERPSASQTRLPPSGNKTNAPPIAQWLAADTQQVVVQHGGHHYAHSLNQRDFVAHLVQHLGTLHPGCPLATAEVSARPHAALALSTLLRKDAMPSMELTHPQALDYLRGVALAKPRTNGWCLVTYQGSGLGWVKGTGNRLNNHWPAAWRLRRY
jgi:16S rRNA C967 or C1407 C5-methylase (RsmB/RsmF family)/NOL1/NOP2/fmu family ribosome biogenesis protein